MPNHVSTMRFVNRNSPSVAQRGADTALLLRYLLMTGFIAFLFYWVARPRVPLTGRTVLLI